MTIYLDSDSKLFYRLKEDSLRSMELLPWKLQMPFFLTFLHNRFLSERFKDMEIIGAIDLYIKWKFCNGEELTIDI